MVKIGKDLQEFSYSNIPDITNKSIILRSCLNVTTDKIGEIIDPTRFYESLPLIIELSQKAKGVTVLGHLGRPKQRESKFSLRNVSILLQNELKELGIQVEFIEDLTNENIQKIKGNNNLAFKKVFLIENTRFFEGEESDKESDRKHFAETLASLGDVFVNDAFADYRIAASTYDIAKLLPSYLGPVFLKEVESLSQLQKPQRPFVAVLGGAKLSEKLDVLNTLAETADKILIGGAMAYTLLKAKGLDIGKSLFEPDKLDVANEIIRKYSDKIELPLDHMVSKDFNDEAMYEYTDDTDIPDDTFAIDVGWKTIERYIREINKAKTILWNGPMGVFEWDHSSVGTLKIGKAIGDNKDSYNIAGGGDSIAAINKLELDGFDHISTGGGAMLSFIANETFPTLDVILNK